VGGELSRERERKSGSAIGLLWVLPRSNLRQIGALRVTSGREDQLRERKKTSWLGEIKETGKTFERSRLSVSMFTR